MCGAAGVERPAGPTKHYVHNGGMLHALPDVSKGGLGTDDWDLVTCEICLTHRVPADEGHRFEITFRSAGSYIVTGDEHHRDAEDWSDAHTIVVRAWSLKSALKKAHDLPFSAWYPKEDEGADSQ